MKYYGRNDILAREKYIIEVVYFKLKIIRNLINKNAWGLEYYILAYSVHRLADKLLKLFGMLKPMWLRIQRN